MNIEQRYLEAHLLWYKTNRPSVVSDGYYPGAKMPDVIKTNGLTDYCVNMINFLGGRAKRINVVMRASDKKVKSESGQGYFMEKRYTKSVKKGTADILASLRGRSIDIEIKNKHTGDTMKPRQWKEKYETEKSGGQYWIITCAEDFLIQLDAFLYG